MHRDSPLEITLFGSPKIRQAGDTLINFRHRKSLALLAYLVVTGESHSRDHLAGLLWGESSGVNALGGLRKALAELRSKIGPYLLEENRCVAFNHALPARVDVLTFQQGLTEGRVHQAELLNSAKASALKRAIQQYTGDFLAGFYIQRAPAFEDWATLTRERLRLHVLDGLYLLSKAAYRQGDYPASIHHTRRLLELEPAHEEAHRQLMSLLALTGQRELALLQYESCQKILAETFKIPPQQETTALYQRILQEPTQAAPGREFHLPVPTARLVGRQTDLDTLQSRLSAPACRLLNILGPGGSGKTHLALVLAENIRASTPHRYPDGIVYVPLSALHNIEALPSAIAHQLGFQFHKEHAPLRQLTEHLSGRQMLLILDNFEHLLPLTGDRRNSHPPADESFGPEGLSQILQEVPGIKILVTSRVRLNLKEEVLYPLRGIAYPSSLAASAAILETSPAVDLFIQSARRNAPAFPTDGENLAEIVKICRQVQGMPLGILLAAGWSRMLSPGEIAAQLSAESGIDLLESDSGDFPARQRSLRAVLAYSWRLLSAQEQTTLANLSIFPNAFELEAAQQVAGARFGDLRSLIDHSLIQRTLEHRYVIHEFTRQFAKEKQTAPEETRARYWDYYAARLPRWAAEIKSARQMEAIQKLDLEIDNIRTAWDLAVSSGNLAFLEQALDGLLLYYNWRYRYPEGSSACQQLVDYFQSADGQARLRESTTHQRLYARTLTWLGAIKPTTQAESLLRQARTILQELAISEDAPAETISALAYNANELGQVLAQTGNLTESFKLLEESTQISEQLGDRWLLADNLLSLASQLWDQSQYKQAKKHLYRSLQIQQEIGDRRGAAAVLIWLGLNTLYLGDSQGEEYFRQGMAIYREMGDHTKVFNGVEMAAIALMVIGKYSEARTLLEETGMMNANFFLRQDSIQSLMASTLIHQGHYEEGKKQAENGLKYARQFANPIEIGFSLIAYGWASLIHGDYKQAFELFHESAERCGQHDIIDMATWAQAFGGYAQYRLGNFSAARKAFQHAFNAAIETDAFVSKVFTAAPSLPFIAALGEVELAVELYTALHQLPAIQNSLFFRDIIGRPVDELTSSLPKETAQQARHRGQGLNLDTIVSKITPLLLAWHCWGHPQRKTPEIPGFYIVFQTI